MNQRKVVIVPTIRAAQNTGSKRVELVPFTSDEADLIVTYIRDPKAFLENNECETMTVSMESLLSRKYTDQVFGRTYCGLTFPATAQDVLNVLKALPHHTGVEAFINDLIGEHVNDSSFYTTYKVVAVDDDIDIYEVRDFINRTLEMHQHSLLCSGTTSPFKDAWWFYVDGDDYEPVEVLIRPILREGLAVQHTDLRPS